MDPKQRAARLVQVYPPIPLKEKIVKYGKGNMSQFVIDAVREKIAAIEKESASRNSVSKLLGAG